jgi:hypothetical protein
LALAPNTIAVNGYGAAARGATGSDAALCVKQKIMHHHFVAGLV